MMHRSGPDLGLLLFFERPEFQMVAMSAMKEFAEADLQLPAEPAVPHNRLSGSEINPQWNEAVNIGHTIFRPVAYALWCLDTAAL